MKRGTKQGLSLILCVAMLLLAAPFSVWAQGGAFASADVPLPSDEQLAVLQNGGQLTSLTAPKQTLSQAAAYAWRGSASSLPSSYDLRAQGKVTAVADQVISGPCWSFAATAAIESQQLPFDAQADYSEKFMCFFAYGQPEQYAAMKAMMGSGSVYEWGGFTLSPVYSMANWTGPAYESDFPYGTFDDIEQSFAAVSQMHLQEASVLPVVDHTDENEQTLVAAVTQKAKQLMLDSGSALTAAYCSADMASDYNDATFAWYNETANLTDHGVAIVGWDDDFPKSAFPHSEYIHNNGAWLVKNSWGTSWGDNGYFWLSYEDRSLTLESVYRFEPTDNYDHLYSYDTFVYPGAMAFDSSKAVKMANTFTTQRAEQLEAVSFYTSDENTAYTVKVYRGLRATSDNPTSGTLCATLSGTASYWGYHTLTLPSSVSLKAGERFSVVVELTNPENIYTTYLEMGLIGATDTLTLSSKRQSYVYSAGYGWEDTVDTTIDAGSGQTLLIGNFPIKAFTSDASHVVFSRDSGPVPYGTQITLSTDSGKTILYTTDGSDPTQNGTVYSAPITVDRDMTVKASVDGVVSEKQYTKTQAALISLLVKDGFRSPFYVEREDTVITVSSATLTLVPVANGTVTVDGQTVVSGQAVSLSLPSVGGGNAKVVKIDVTNDGCEATSATLLLKTAGAALPISVSELTVSPLSLTYTGQPQAVEPIVTYQGSTLRKDVDYTLAGETVVTDAGSHTLLLKGIGLYDGEREIVVTVSYCPGDIDHDGTVTTSDARTALLYCVNGAQLTEEELAILDVSGDGAFNTNDVRVLLRMTLAA